MVNLLILEYVICYMNYMVNNYLYIVYYVFKGKFSKIIIVFLSICIFMCIVYVYRIKF